MYRPEDVVDQVLRGEMSRDEAIRLHPDMRDRLMLLTDLSDELSALPRQRIDPEFRNAARLRLLQRIYATRRRSRWQRLRDRAAGVPAWATRTAAAVAAGGMLASGVSLASASALPDDTLYPVKRAVEQVQLVMAVSDEAKADAYLGLADQRAAEMAAVAGNIDEVRLKLLANDYGQALDQMGVAVEKISLPPPMLIEKVQTHLASQAGELEARALNSSSKPSVQRALSQSEVAASNVADRVVLVAERQGGNIRLAANPQAAATAMASSRTQIAESQTTHRSGTPVPTPAVFSSDATKPAPADSPLPPLGPVTLQSLDTLYDRVWNVVAAAPFMSHEVRQSLELSISAAKQDTHEGTVGDAVAEINKAGAMLSQAVKDSQATQFTASRIEAHLTAIISSLNSYKPVPGSREFGLRRSAAPLPAPAKPAHGPKAA